MLHAISHFALLAQLAVNSAVPEPSAPSVVPFDTTISVTRLAGVTLRQSDVRGTVHTNDGRVLMEDVAGDVQGTTSKGRVTERRVEKGAGMRE